MEIKRGPMVIAGKTENWAKGTAAIGARGFVFLSGSVGFNLKTGQIPKEPGEQAKLALENIRQILEEYGSELKYILHIFQFVKGQFPNGDILNDPKWIEISRAMQEYWKEHCPELSFENQTIGETLIGVTSLAMPELDVEIQAVAAIP